MCAKKNEHSIAKCKKDSSSTKKFNGNELKKWEKEMLTCTACGFCKSVCPSFKESGWETKSPRARVLLSYGILENEITPDDSVIDALAKCMTCADCKRECPSKVDVVEIIECARKDLYDNGYILDAYKRIADSIEKFNNPYNESKGVAETLKEKTKPSEIGVFIGCTSTYRHPEIASAKTSILKKLGINHTLVDSVCCGSPLKRTGSGGNLFNRQVKDNLERIKKLGIKKLIISCAGCYKTFKHDYPKLDFEIMHLTEFLNQQPLKLKPLNKKVAYHDPCHLGRAMGVYEPPRELLKKIPGVTVVEMEHNREKALCCGGGGGVRAAYPDMSLQVAIKRLEEAKKAGAEILVSACPFCVDNLLRAEHIARTGIKIMDIIALINAQLMWVSAKGLWENM